MTDSRSILAIDYGTRRIGVAMTDALGVSAQPLTVIENADEATALERLREAVAAHEIDLVLVGIPLNMDGSEGPMAEKVRRFMAALEQKLGAAIPVQGRDERLTSWTAEKEEFAKGRLPWLDKGKIDMRSAMILLEDYLSESDPKRGLLPEDAPAPLSPEKSRRKDRIQRRSGRRRR